MSYKLVDAVRPKNAVKPQARSTALLIEKGLNFLTSSNFRRAKVRQLLWPLFRRLYANVEYLGIRTDDGSTVLVHSSDQFITIELLKFSQFRTSNFSRALQLLDRLGVPRDGTFVDVGANIGTETVSALGSRRFGRVVAIEPDGRNYRLLRANLIINGLADRAFTIQRAVSNRKGIATMALSATNHGDHRVIEDGAVLDGQHDAERVEMMRLDDILADIAGAENVSLVWVDTQGYDGLVLAGAPKLIESRVPFVIEFWPSAMRQAGGLEVALRVIETGFSVYYNLSAEDWMESHPVAGIRELVVSLNGELASADLLLIRRLHQ